MPGFPIRTSADQRLVDGFPQLFAVTHVLHRFLAPRHPPLALYSLEEFKMLVLALQFSRCDVQRALRGRCHGRVRCGRGTPRKGEAVSMLGRRGNDSLETEEKIELPARQVEEV